jgi:BirA family biotin operon repressor/biotin-[acetyl-CoA-carboxylase] ligase
MDLTQERVDDLLSHSTVSWRPVTVVASTGSTNADLLAVVGAEDVGEGQTLAAGEQVAGRGRRGRMWASPAGTTLSFSVVLNPPLERAGFVPALTALAVAQAIRSVSGVPATLKWPNDIMIGSGKVAGILAQGLHGRVVVGCGVNVTVAGADLPVPTATSLSVHADPVDRAELLVAALSELESAMNRWRESSFSALGSGLLDSYRTACTTIGNVVEVSLPDETVVTGTAQGVDDDGGLVLGTESGPRTLTAGDVTHLRLA